VSTVDVCGTEISRPVLAFPLMPEEAPLEVACAGGDSMWYSAMRPFR